MSRYPWDVPNDVLHGMRETDVEVQVKPSKRWSVVMKCPASVRGSEPIVPIALRVAPLHKIRNEFLLEELGLHGTRTLEHGPALR